MKKRPRAFTLTEAVVAFGIAFFVLLLFALCFENAVAAWRKSSGLATARTQLEKAKSSLERELEHARFAESATGLSTAGAGGVPAGTAVWFLSAENPATGQVQRSASGRPLWQRNVLVYPAVPNNHNATFGSNCSGGAGTGGLDTQCPHKVLIRKVIDGPVDHPTEPGAEGLMSYSQIGPYLTRPDGYSTQAMAGEAGLEETSLLCYSLLYFRLQRLSASKEFLIDCRTLDVASARREKAIGQTSLEGDRHSLQQIFAVYPKN